MAGISNNGNAPSLEDAVALLDHDGKHAVLLYIESGKKGPAWPGWQRISYDQTQHARYQSRLREYPNTGVLLGAPSGHLCAIDWDTDAGLRAFLDANPDFASTLATRGKRGAQLWAYVHDPRPHRIHALKVVKTSALAVDCKESPDKDGRVTIGEFRAEGGQSVIRGIHPDGCHYTWLCSERPITVSFDSIIWPGDIATPWEQSRKHENASGDTLLARAIAVISIDFLWENFGYPERRTNPVPSPFRTDNTPGHPSFSVYDQGRRFKDHNSSYETHRGDSFDFYQLASGQDSHKAFKDFVELAGLGDELHEPTNTADPDKDQPDTRPEIVHPNSDRYISDFARELGGILKCHGFHRFHGSAVQIREVTVKAHNSKEYKVKKLVDLSATLFSTIIETYCRPIVPATVKKDKVKIRKSVSLEMAKRTLVCLDFVDQLPEIKLWTDARLPVRSGNRIILTKPGYDSATGVYTSPDAPAIDETLTVETAAKEWRELLREFCFPKSLVTEHEQSDDKLQQPEKERCIAVALAGALTPLCLYLMPEKAKRPGFAASANAEGAGKTLLLSFGMVAKLGFVPTGSAPDNEEEMRKVIDSAVHHAVPILFFDNLKSHLSSGELEAFITSSTRRYRQLGSTNYSESDNLSTVYITANFATYSPDLRRRLLAVELFLEEARAEERSIERFLDEDALIQMRPRLISILWTFIKYWHQYGEPPSSKLLPSFEHWSNVVAGIVENAGFSSPCELAPLKTGGDTDTQDMQSLVEKMNPLAEFRFSDVMDLARDHHLFQRLIPTESDMDKEQSSRMGKIIRKFVGRVFNGQYRFCLSEGTRKTERYFVVDLKKP